MSHESVIKKLPAVLLLFCLWFLNNKTVSSPYYDDNVKIRLAHRELYALHLATSERLLQAEEIKNNLNGYITFYRLYGDIIALTISNSPGEFRKRLPDIEKNIRTLKELPAGTPEYRMLIGEACIYAGLLNVKYDNRFSGLLEILKGYNYLKDNEEEYPSFEEDNKLIGLLQIGVAFMPGALRWGAKLFNIESNPREGLKNLARFSDFARGKPGYDEEAFLFTMAGYRLMNQDVAAMKLIKEKMCGFKEMAVLNLIAATVCAQSNDAETALALLADIEPEKLEIAFPQLLYMKGKTKLMRLDPDTDIPLLEYLKVSSGSDYVKTILYDLACFYYVSANTTKYREYIELVKSKGRDFLSRDVEASFEAGKPGLPDYYLMRADLLVRGGYFIKAADELSYIPDATDLKDDDKVLFYFLKGECFRLRNLVHQAESEYLNCIGLGERSGSFIAQSAMVNSGIMMEKNGFKAEAEKYYNSCIRFSAKSNPYSDFYKNKARAGLIRLSLSE